MNGHRIPLTFDREQRTNPYKDKRLRLLVCSATLLQEDLVRAGMVAKVWKCRTVFSAS